MKISIIVPVYNVEAYILECLQSVASQTYTGEIECLIIDDCGSDKSISIAQNFISSYSGTIAFKIIHREKNGGLSAARNTGIKHATGDYIYFLDSDDYLFPHSIATLVALSVKYSGVDLVQGNCEQGEGLLHTAHFEETRYLEYYDDVYSLRKLLLSGFPISAWNKLLRREWLLENSMYFEEGLFHEDNLMQFFYSKNIKTMAVSPIDTYHYRTCVSNSIMNSSDRGNRYISVLRIVEIIASSLGNSNRKAEVSYLLSIASIHMSISFWNHSTDKSALKKREKEMFCYVRRLPNVPLIVKFSCFYLTLPRRLTTNRYSLFVYNQILKLKKYVHDEVYG